MSVDPLDELRCENEGCGRLVECFVCETCAEHCALEDPEFCWECHESWRLGKGDPAIAEMHESVPTTGSPTLNGEPIPAAPRPRRVH